MEQLNALLGMLTALSKSDVTRQAALDLLRRQIGVSRPLPLPGYFLFGS